MGQPMSSGGSGGSGKAQNQGMPMPQQGGSYDRYQMASKPMPKPLPMAGSQPPAGGGKGTQPPAAGGGGKGQQPPGMPQQPGKGQQPPQPNMMQPQQAPYANLQGGPWGGWNSNPNQFAQPNWMGGSQMAAQRGSNPYGNGQGGMWAGGQPGFDLRGGQPQTGGLEPAPGGAPGGAIGGAPGGNFMHQGPGSGMAGPGQPAPGGGNPYAGYGNKQDTGAWDQANEWTFDDVGRMLGSARNEGELYAMYSALANDPGRGSGNRAAALARQWIEENKMGGGSMGKLINSWEGDSGFANKPIKFDMRTGKFTYEQPNWDWDKMNMGNMAQRDQFALQGGPMQGLVADGKYTDGANYGQTKYTRALDNWQDIMSRRGQAQGNIGPSYAGQYGTTMNNKTVDERRAAIEKAYGPGVWGNIVQSLQRPQ